MRLCLAWVGKERGRDPEAELCLRYMKRIGVYLPLEQRVIKPFVSSDGGVVIQKEGERLAAVAAAKDYVVALDERGKALSSKGLADLIGTRRDQGDSRMVFMIGGAMGLAPALRQRADFMLSLSQMTLPHAMARVIVLEQIYRALCILAGHPYHHEG